MALLLHSCCGPCLGGSLSQLKEHGDIVTFWENPNIHPYLEYKSRFDSYVKLARDMGLKTKFGDLAYGLHRFLKFLDGRFDRPDRCRKCYELRLTAAAGAAKKGGFAAFSTTLLISPYQDHALLKKTGEEIGAREGIPFFYQDFRPGFKATFSTAREHELYRQKYCGCIFSEFERFSGDKRFQLSLTDPDIPSDIGYIP